MFSFHHPLCVVLEKAASDENLGNLKAWRGKEDVVSDSEVRTKSDD